MLGEDDGIWIADGREQQPLSVVRRRRNYELHARAVRDLPLDRIGVELWHACAASERRADRYLRSETPARTEAEAPELRAKLVKGEVEEAEKLDLCYGDEPCDSKSERRAEDRAFS